MSQLKTNSYKIISVVLGIFVAGALLWWLSSAGRRTAGNELAPPATVIAQTGELRPILIERGLLQPSLDQLIFSTYNGQVERMIAEGTQVEVGDPIIWFRTDDIDDNIETVRGNLAGDIAHLRAQQARYLVQKKSYNLSVQQAEAQLEIARLNLEKIHGKQKTVKAFDAIRWMRQSLIGVTSARPLLEIETNRRIAELNYKQALGTLDATNRLYKKGFTDGLKVAAKTLVVERTQAALSVANTRVLLKRAGPGASAFRRAELTVIQNALNLKRVRFQRISNLEIARREIELAQIEVERSYRELIGKLEKKRKSIIRAPIRGTVAFVDIWKGSRDSLSPLQIGETRGINSDLCRVVDDSVMRARTLINEIDASEIRKGMPVIIKLPALADAHGLPEFFPGIVDEISPRALDRNRALGSQAVTKSGEALIRVVQVFIDIVLDELDDEQQQKAKTYLKRGMSAVVSFELAPVASGTIIPTSALWFTSTSAQIVVKLQNGEFQPRPVRVVRSTVGRAVIEALEPGTEIVNDIAVYYSRFKLDR